MVVQGADLVWSGLLGVGEVVGAAEGGSKTSAMLGVPRLLKGQYFIS